jgi:hypothetical protein
MDDTGPHYVNCPQTSLTDRRGPTATARGLGFDLVDIGMSNRMNGVFSREADQYLRGRPIHDLYRHSQILCRKTRDVPDFVWGNVEMDVVNNTRYPPPRPAAPQL